jgi:hypothetical protein
MASESASDGVTVWSRRTFLRNSAALPPLILGLFSAVVTISCAADSSSDDSSDSGDLSGSITANHGHTVTITEAQLAAGDAVTLTLTTGSGHTHTLELSAAQVQSINMGNSEAQTTNVDSTGHTHNVTFN